MNSRDRPLLGVILRILSGVFAAAMFMSAKAVSDGVPLGEIVFFRVATRPDWVAEFSLAGALSSISPLGSWWAAVHNERKPDDPNAQAYLEEYWRAPWGDRRQEIVFIGSGIDWPSLKAKLDACLVPQETASSLDQLPAYPDPLPQWKYKKAA